MKSHVLLVLMMIAAAAPVPADEGPSVGVVATPEAHLPVGARAQSYSFGLGGRLEGLLAPSASFPVTPGLDFGYAFIPLSLNQSGFAGDTNLTLVRAGAEAKLPLEIGERLSVFARAHVSGFYGTLLGEFGGDALGVALGGGAGMGFQLSPEVTLDVAADYGSYLGLYDGVSLSVGTTVRVAGGGNAVIPRADFSPAGSGPAEGYIRFSEIDVDRVFPVLYKYYDDSPIGRATVVNEGSREVHDVEVRLTLRQFMDAPKVSARIDSLEPGEEREIDLYALFTEDILSVTEGAKVAAELSADYRTGSRDGADSEVFTLETFDRNALRWNDDRKIAAFVTARDEEVQRFARNVASVVDDYGVEAIARELQIAMVFFCAMAEHRLAYVVDPASPYFELSRDTTAVDSVQFPRQTLQYRAGDCDDISATYAALLEAAGVPTAFITVPGHIYTAFRLQSSPEEARRTFSRPEDLIVRDDGSVWVPVETTLLDKGFGPAWAEGARQWQKHTNDGKARFFPTARAWRTFEPVAFGVSDYEVEIPDRSRVASGFRGELDRFVRRQIADREAELLARLKEQPGDVRTRNRLGVLYARYGKYERAEAQFQRIVAAEPFAPALVNLANIALLNGEYGAARASYERALEEDPDDEAALLGLARVEYEGENYEAAHKAYARLAGSDPDLAERFEYLGTPADGEAGRAAARERSATTVKWEVE